MVRAPCCDERLGLKKGPWTPDEDQKLVAFVQEHGHGNWRALPEKAGLARCGKSCRLRWTNYLRPDIKRGRFSLAEDESIIQLHAILGNRWSAIASHLPRRTDNEIKNYWNTHLKKRLTQMGIDPVTHTTTPIATTLAPPPQYWTPLTSTRLTHRMQWELTVAETQARLSSRRTSTTLASPIPHPSSLFLKSWEPKPERQDWSTALQPLQQPFQMPFVAIENLLSPTSILQAPAPEYSDSSSGASGNKLCNANTSTVDDSLVSLLHPHSTGDASFQALIDESPSLSDDLFWSSATLDDELMTTLDVDDDQGMFLQAFDSSSLQQCHGAPAPAPAQ